MKTQTLKRNPEQLYDQNLVQWKDTDSMGMNPNFPFVKLSRERPTFCKLWWKNPDQSFSRQVQITLQQREAEALRMGSFP